MSAVLADNACVGIVIARRYKIMRVRPSIAPAPATNQKSRSKRRDFTIRARRALIAHWLRYFAPNNRVSAGGQGAFGRRLSLIRPENLITIVVFRLADARPQRLA